MKRRSIWMFSFTALLGLTGTLWAQDPSPASQPLSSVFPVVPITVNLERIPQFFREALNPEKNPWYSSIEAEVDAARNPSWIQIVVRERASDKQIYYCNSHDTVNIWTSLGREAYYVPIDFTTSQGSDAHNIYQFSLQDGTKRQIVWKFIQESSVADLWGTSQFMPRADDFGLVLLRGQENYRAASGSFVAIGDQQYPAAEDSFYSTGVVIADIQPVNEQWNLTSFPAQLNPGNKWTLHSSGGRDETLAIQQANGTSFIVDETEPNFPNSATVRMDLVRSENQYALNSLTVMARSESLLIAFNPALPLPAPMAQGVTEVGFTMGEDKNPDIASGQVVASRGMSDEHLDWSFNSPTWAKAVQLTTGVSVFSSSATQALKKFPAGVP